jgi:hypothetical protein
MYFAKDRLMTEAEWLSLPDPAPLFDYVRNTVSDRKLRLWACACVRRIGPRIPHELGHKAVAVVERFVDGLADQRELLGVADAFAPCGRYNATYGHPAMRAAHSPFYRETVGQAASYAARCCKRTERDRSGRRRLPCSATSAAIHSGRLDWTRTALAVRLYNLPGPSTRSTRLIACPSWPMPWRISAARTRNS